MNKLLTKIIGASIEGLSKNYVPNGAIKYNLVRGVSNTKGEFKIVSFFDANNKLVQSIHDYPQNGLKRIIKITESKNSHSLSETIFEDGIKSGEINTNISKGKDKFGYLMTREHVSTDIHHVGDLHEIARLQAGKGKKGFEYYTFWNGKAPYIHKYNNISNKEDFNEAFLEYLPCMVSFDTKSRISQRFTHISKMLEERYGLKGIAPRAKRVSHSELNPTILSSNGHVTLGSCNPASGQIRVSKELTDSESLLKNLGHEYRHAKDFSDIWRLSDGTPDIIQPGHEIAEIVQNEPAKGTLRFARKSYKKGEILETSKKGKKIQELKQALDNYTDASENYQLYSENLLEKRANIAEQTEAQKLECCLDNIVKFLFNS